MCGVEDRRADGFVCVLVSFLGAARLELRPAGGGAAGVGQGPGAAHARCARAHGRAQERLRVCNTPTGFFCDVVVGGCRGCRAGRQAGQKTPGEAVA